MFVPSASATFQATSYQRDIVASLLDSVSVDEAGVAVPEFNWQTYQRGSDQRFIAAAEALGLRVAVRTGPRQRHREGAIISVRPYAGTVLAPGDTVHLTVAGPRQRALVTFDRRVVVTWLVTTKKGLTREMRSRRSGPLMLPRLDSNQ